MKAPDTSSEREIFAAAAALPREERAAYLDSTCVGRPELRANAEVWLGEHEASEFMQTAEDDLGVHPEQAGERIGNYKLLEKIGEGGFGTVWAADQERPVRRRVALKIIKLGMDTKEVIARFGQERQALAMMDHPHIAKVLDAGATEWGRPYFVMELVRGIKITDYCDQANLSTADRLTLFIQVCQAVQHAHQKGIIHRDLKPSNILVTLHDGAPVPKVIDFGVAKATQQQRLTDLTIYTEFQQMIGTPVYMSPEQAEMSGLDIDTRSDIYSLGVLLYELLTGRTPFDPDTMRRRGLDEIRRAICEQEPMAPSQFVSALDGERRMGVARRRQTDSASLARQLRGDLDWIVMKAIEKVRTRRYETANGLALDIRRHLDREPVLARPPNQLYRAQRMVQRNQFAFAAGGMVALALLLAVIVLAVSRARITREKNEKEVALHQRGEALAEAKDRLFDALLSRARAVRFSGQMGQRIESLDALAEAARIRPDERLRDEAIAAMALPDVRLGPGWTLDYSSTIDASFHYSATCDAGGVIVVRSLPDRREVRRIETGRKPYRTTLSKDGRFVALIDESRSLQVWRVENGQPLLGTPLEHCGGLAFHKDGADLVVGQQDAILHFDLANGSVTRRWQARGSVNSLAFHPVHRQLAVGYIDAEVVSVYDLTAGTLFAELPVGAMREQVVAWHPDGFRLAISGSHPPIQIWNVGAKRRLATLGGHVQQVIGLSIHPKGELLASCGYDAVFRLWCPASGRPLLQMPRQVWGMGFSADGRWIGTLVEGDENRLLEVVESPEYRTIVSSLGADEGTYFDGDISPDGNWLAMGMKDGARLWNLASGRELAFLPPGSVQSVLIRLADSELITCGDAGVLRWPILDRADGFQPPRFGPPQQVALPFTPTRAACSGDGRSLAVVSESAGSAVIVDLATGTVTSRILSHPGACFVALSPDGKFVATAGWHLSSVRLWEVRTGEMLHGFDAFNLVNIAFAPDSRTLAVTRANELDLWNAEAHQSDLRLSRSGTLYGSQAAFSTDGKLIAVERSSGVISLVEAATGRTLARLTDPSGSRATWMRFAPDGTRLVTASYYAKAIHVWDLRAIRARLETMGLDWEWPDFPTINQTAE